MWPNQLDPQPQVVPWVPHWVWLFKSWNTAMLTQVNTHIIEPEQHHILGAHIEPSVQLTDNNQKRPSECPEYSLGVSLYLKNKLKNGNLEYEYKKIQEFTSIFSLLSSNYKQHSLLFNLYSYSQCFSKHCIICLMNKLECIFKYFKVSVS